MSHSIRDIIVESLSRSNLCSTRQPAPGHMVESALNMLKGISYKYSNNNLLQFLRREYEISNSDLSNTIKIGEYDPTIYEELYISDSVPVTGEYPEYEYVYSKSNDSFYEKIVNGQTGVAEWIMVTEESKTMEEYRSTFPDVEIKDVASIRELYLSNGSESNNDTPLHFVSFEDFRSALFGSYVYTWQPLTDKLKEIKIKFFKSGISNTHRLVVIYNVKYNFELNTELRIPGQYIELFTIALTHALAIKYPRLDSTQVNILKDELTSFENSIAMPTRANKLILRKGYSADSLNMASLKNGSFIFGGN